MAELEKQTILNAITELNGDKLQAARLLGIGKTTLYRKLKDYAAQDYEALRTNSELSGPEPRSATGSCLPPRFAKRRIFSAPSVAADVLLKGHDSTHHSFSTRPTVRRFLAMPLLARKRTGPKTCRRPPPACANKPIPPP